MVKMRCDGCGRVMRFNNWQAADYYRKIENSVCRTVIKTGDPLLHSWIIFGILPDVELVW